MPKKQSYKNYFKKVDTKNPKHILAIVILIILAGIVIMWVVKALIYIAVIVGLFYLVWLVLQRKK